MQDNILMETVRGQLRGLADPEYREFHSGLSPGITGIIGVRTPQLRGLLKQLIKDSWQEYIKQISLAWKQAGRGEEGVYYGEMILRGLCIYGEFKGWDGALPCTEEFVSAISNQAVCDIFCSSLKVVGKYRQESWEPIRPYLRSGKKHGIRLVVVMVLSHFVDEDYVEADLELTDHIRHQGYHVKMAVAWAISIYFIRLPEPVMPYLEHNHLDDWASNRALQKIAESCRVDGETKAVVRTMKRPVSQGQEKSLVPAFQVGFFFRNDWSGRIKNQL